MFYFKEETWFSLRKVQKETLVSFIAPFYKPNTSIG